jgi:predicted ATPase
MRTLPGLDAGHVDTLAELPADGRTGQRLMALAQLIEAHLELSGRAAAAFREIRRKLAASVPATPRPRAY